MIISYILKKSFGINPEVLQYSKSSFSKEYFLKFFDVLLISLKGYERDLNTYFKTPSIYISFQLLITYSLKLVCCISFSTLKYVISHPFSAIPYHMSILSFSPFLSLFSFNYTDDLAFFPLEIGIWENEQHFPWQEGKGMKSVNTLC